MTCVFVRPQRMTLFEAKELSGFEHGWAITPDQLWRTEGDRRVRITHEEARAAQLAEEHRIMLPEDGCDSPIIMCGEAFGGAVCSACGYYGELLCDWPVGRGKTCDMSLCEQCAREVAEDKHLCQLHFPMFVKSAGVTRVNPWPPKRGGR